jgi:hypothetical protein
MNEDEIKISEQYVVYHNDKHEQMLDNDHQLMVKYILHLIKENKKVI